MSRRRRPSRFQPGQQQQQQQEPQQAGQQDDIVSDVSTHFRINVPSGQSKFTVQVPQAFIQEVPRRFFFQELHLVPEYFSLEVEKLKLDADPQLDSMLERQVQMKIDYHDPKTAYGATYEHGAVAMNTDDFLKKLNRHFEKEKPSWVQTTPFFIDWIDETLQKANPPAQYVPLQCTVYYGEVYNEEKHFNALPSSAQELEGVNNYLPPVGGSMDINLTYLSRIRLRLWLAPYTRAVFSNTNLFVQELAFKEEDLGVAVKNQVHLVNDRPYWSSRIVAAGAPRLELSKLNFKLTIQASDTPIISRIKHVSLKGREWLDNAKLTSTLTQAFRQAARFTNTTFALIYDSANSVYKFNFPEAGSNVTISIQCDPEFAHRLGFGYETSIVRGMTATAQKDRYSSEDALKRALAVVYDTGPIVCQYDSVSSNTTSGLTDKTVAALYPTASGMLSMPSGGCSWARAFGLSTTDTFPIVVNTQSTAARANVTFHLKRIYDNQSISDFAWSCDAYVYGELKGSSCLPHRWGSSNV